MQPGVSLGFVIRSRRQARGLTLASLARQVRLNKSTILRLEQDHITSPAPDILVRLAHALELPVTELYALAGHPVSEALPPLRTYLQAVYGPLPEPVLREVEQLLDQACAAQR